MFISFKDDLDTLLVLEVMSPSLVEFHLHCVCELLKNECSTLRMHNISSLMATLCCKAGSVRWEKS